MRKYKMGDKKALTLFVLVAFMMVLVGMATTIGLKEITDYALANNLKGVIQVVVIVLGTKFLAFLISFLVMRTQENYIKKSTVQLKNAYIEKLMEKNLLSIHAETESHYLSQLTHDMDRYQQVYFRNLISLVLAFAEIVVAVAMIIWIEPRLLIITVTMIFFAYQLSKHTSKPIKKLEKNKSSALNVYTACIQETLDGFTVIKQYQIQKKQTQKFGTYAKDVQTENLKLDLKTSRIDALNSGIQLFIIAALMVAGLLVAHYYGMSVGTALFIGTSLSSSIWPMQQVIPYISQMNGIVQLLEDFDEALISKQFDTPQDIDQIQEVSMVNASLGYDGQNILEHVNLTFKANEKVLLVGQSGSGKSTLLKALRRQLELNNGKLEVNGYTLETIDPQSYFSQVAVVDQIGFIFNGTIAENITMNRQKDIDLHELLERVGLQELNLNFELMNNGSNISGGQRARLMLARALYLDASMIVCDEILASLDEHVAREIERDLLMQDGLVINVTHIYFEENLKNYDRIYRVMNGTVQEITQEAL